MDEENDAGDEDKDQCEDNEADDDDDNLEMMATENEFAEFDFNYKVSLYFEVEKLINFYISHVNINWDIVLYFSSNSNCLIRCRMFTVKGFGCSDVVFSAKPSNFFDARTIQRVY